MTRITITEQDWERKERERLQDDAEKLESAKIENFRIEKMKKSNSNAVSAHPSHPELPTMSIPLIDEPNSWPHQEDDHPPAPVGQSDQQRHGLHQACDWDQCDLSEWWKHNENEAHRLSMKATTIMAGPAIRKRRKLERRKLSNGLAWWNAWWRRMEVMAAFERDNLILEKMKIKIF